MTQYPIVIVELAAEDGGGFLGLAPDLHGCMSDGSTRAEALLNTEAAMAEWLSAAELEGRQIPPPGTAARNATKREKALLGAVRALSEQFDTLDDRIENLAREVGHLGEVAESQEAWARVDQLAAISGVGKKKTRVATC